MPADFLENLNPQQRAAVEHDAGPLAVLAGPGTGKTRVIVHRIARLVAPRAEGGRAVEPESIVALAFTVKSAEQLRERLAEMIGPGAAERVQAHTCHSYGRRLLDRFGDTIGVPWRASIMDSAQRKRLLARLIEELGLFKDRAAVGRRALAERAWTFIDSCLNDAVTPDVLAAWCAARLAAIDSGEAQLPDGVAAEAERARVHDLRELGALYDAFERERLPRGLLTFDDYLLLPIRLLTERRDVAAQIHDSARHVLVDEFQDWNPAQIEFLARLAPPGRNPDLFVVGDDDQSIYGFRGADDKAFARFQHRWPGAARTRLEINYRSGEPIVGAANAIIAQADDRFDPEKTIIPAPGARGDGRPCSLEGVIVSHDSESGAVIAEMIRADRAAAVERGLPAPAWRSYAVLVRGHLDRDRIVNELDIHAVPVADEGPSSPASDAGVKDVFAWLSLLVDPSSRADAQRLLLRPPIGVDAGQANSWLDEHRALAHAERATPAFPDWLGGAHADHAAAARFAPLWKNFRAATASMTHADGLVDRIIHGADPVHAEALTSRQRAARVRSIVAMMQFVRRTVENLDAPADGAEFLRYYDDLDEADQGFAPPGDSRVDRRPGDDDDEADAVHVMTAHSAKGLEFDTVFLVKVRPAGFPSNEKGRRGDLDVALPGELTGRTPVAHADEERRLFYVACTRARRRLVLLAKHKKTTGRGASGDYYLELTQDNPRLGLAQSDSKRWLEGAGATAPAPGEGDDADAPSDALDARARWIARAVQRARADAMSALFRADRADLTERDLEALRAEIDSSLARLGALAQWRDRGEAPAFARASGPHSDALAAIARRMAVASDDDGSITRPMRAPIALSYSAITQDESCPRCFYARYVLGLSERKTVGLEAGWIAHGALERFWLEHREAEAEGRPAPGFGRLAEIGSRLERDARRGRAPEPGFAEQIDALLRNYWEKFRDDALLLEVERVIRMPWESSIDGSMHTMTAKIDRIDQMPDGSFRIVDYKTGQALEKFRKPKKDDLQLCLYTLSLMHDQCRDEPPAGVAEYWLLAYRERGAIPLAELGLDKARERIDKAVAGMMAGRFPRRKSDWGCRGLCTVLGEE